MNRREAALEPAATVGPVRRKGASFQASGYVTRCGAADRTVEDDWTPPVACQRRASSCSQPSSVYSQTDLTLLSTALRGERLG